MFQKKQDDQTSEVQVEEDKDLNKETKEESKTKKTRTKKVTKPKPGTPSSPGAQEASEVDHDDETTSVKTEASEELPEQSKPKFVTKLHDVTVNEDDTATFNVSTNIKDSKFEWFCNNKEIGQSEKYDIQSGNGKNLIEF